jgi:hypothetical protein
MRGFAPMVLSLLIGATPAARGEDRPPDMDVIVHVDTQAARLGKAELAQIYSGTRTTWATGANIVPFNMPPSHALRVELDRVVLDMSPAEVGRYWIDQRIRGGPRPPRQIDDPDLMTKVVARLSGAIGYVPAGFTVPTGVRVVARIRNHKVLEP